MKSLIALVLILGLACPSAFAGGSPDQKHIEKIKKKVDKCLEKDLKVSVETFDSRKLHGSISEAGPETFVLTNESRSTTLGYADVKKIKSPLDPRTKTAIILSVVVGGLLGLTVLGARD